MPETPYEQPVKESLSADELNRLDTYWRAANYLSVGQIYLLANPLMKEPLRLEHIITSKDLIPQLCMKRWRRRWTW